MSRVQELPTVKVSDGKGGYRVINERDFDEAKHKLFSEKPSDGHAEKTTKHGGAK